MASSYVPALSPPLMSSSGLRTTKGDVRIHLHARRAEGGGGVRRGAEGVRMCVCVCGGGGDEGGGGGRHVMKRPSVELSSFGGVMSHSACSHRVPTAPPVALRTRTSSSYTQPVCRPHGMSTSPERTMYP